MSEQENFLRARIEALEKENKELKEQLKNRNYEKNQYII